MDERPLRFEPRMSDTEALMWNLEREPLLRSSFLSITVLDRSPDFEAFRRRVAGAVADIPRLRQRVVVPTVAVGAPHWEDDPGFDLDFHVRRVALTPPGDERGLLDLAALAHQDPFDRSRPLWQFTVVEGLEGGTAALLVKMHHTITDGVGVLRLSTSFVDLARDAPAPADDRSGASGVAPTPTDGPGPPGTGAGGLSAVADTAWRAVAGPLALGLRTAGAVVTGVAHPTRVGRQAVEAAEALRSLGRQVSSDPARSPLWTGRRSLRRRFEVLTVELDRTKAVANALGGTLNDAFVAAMAAAAGAYHREKGAPVDELRTSIVISTKADRTAAANAFVPTRVLVPTGPLDARERFALVRERLATTKQERAVDLTDTMAALFGTLPIALVAGVALQQVETVDFATSNLRGAPVDLYVAGAKVVANYPMGPTGGTAFNASLLSYGNRLDLGLNIDPVAVDDPGLLRECVVRSFDELLALG